MQETRTSWTEDGRSRWLRLPILQNFLDLRLRLGSSSLSPPPSDENERDDRKDGKRHNAFHHTCTSAQTRTHTINHQSSTRRGKIGLTTNDGSNVCFTVDSDWGKRIGRRRPTGTRRNRAAPQSERVHLFRFHFRVPYPTTPASRPKEMIERRKTYDRRTWPQ